MKRGLAVLALVAAVPPSALLTLLTWQWWGWFEAHTGIEALGHSGPANWCFVATLLACGLVGGSPGMAMDSGKRDGARRNG